MSDKRLKCVESEGLCNAMSNRVQSGGENKGLTTFTTMNMETGDFKLSGIVYRTKAKERGLMLNSCPWCGESLEWWN